MLLTKSKIQYADIAKSMYILTTQKNEIKSMALFYLEKLAFGIGLLIMSMVIAYTQEWTNFSNEVLFVEVPFVSIVIVVCAFKSIRNFAILRTLKRIRSEGEETVKIECKDVRFIAYNSLRYDSFIIAIIFVGTNHKKYLYVLPESLFNYKKIRQHIIDKCLFETVELTCYKGTRMLKLFDIWDGYKYCV